MALAATASVNKNSLIWLRIIFSGFNFTFDITFFLHGRIERWIQTEIVILVSHLSSLLWKCIECFHRGLWLSLYLLGTHLMQLESFLVGISTSTSCGLRPNISSLFPFISLIHLYILVQRNRFDDRQINCTKIFRVNPLLPLGYSRGLLTSLSFV